MGITSDEARQQILDDLAAAVERIALAVASLTEAFDLLSVTSADRLDAELFRPTQRAFGRGKRAYTQFADRSGLEAHEITSPSPGPPSQGAKVLIEQAVAAAADAERQVSDLQDSSVSIEFSDGELRTGLREVRASLAELAPAAREFLRGLGR